MFSEYRQHLIEELEKELKAAENISIDDLTSQLCEIGFSCLMCGKCCIRSYGDNRVFLNSSDIHSLKDGFFGDSIIPMLPDGLDISSMDSIADYAHEFEVDTQGKYHTFGWMLKRNTDGNCSFLSDDGKKRCSIYSERPMLCSTYPFYIENGKLMSSECEGLGSAIPIDEATLFAKGLLDRHVIEIKDALHLYERFEDTDISPSTVDNEKHLDAGEFIFVVHDHAGISEFVIKFNK